jgi:hypothetical protein
MDTCNIGKVADRNRIWAYNGSPTILMDWEEETHGGMNIRSYEHMDAESLWRYEHMEL